MKQLSLFDICENNHGGNAESVAAFKSLNGNELRSKVMDHIASCGKAGATCDEIELALGITHQSASARCTELKANGDVHSLTTRRTRSGRSAAVLVDARTTKKFWEY